MTHMRFRPSGGGFGDGLDEPVRLDGLAEEERVLIRAFRRWVEGGSACDAAWNQIAARFGGRPGRPIMAALILLVERLRDSTRRTIQHHAACCPCLSVDELRLLNLVAVAGTGRIDRARGLAADLIGIDTYSDGAQALSAGLDLAEAAQRLAAALAPHGACPVDRPSLGLADATGRERAFGMVPERGKDTDRVPNWLN